MHHQNSNSNCNAGERKAVVTGGTGFLGTELLKQLSGKYQSVICLARSSSPSSRPYENTMPFAQEKEWPSNVTFVKGSVLDVSALSALFDREKPDVCFHLAGLVEHSRSHHANDMYKLHVEGTLNVMRIASANGCKRIIYSSTSGVAACLKAVEANTIIPSDGPTVDTNINTNVNANANNKSTSSGSGTSSTTAGGGTLASASTTAEDGAVYYCQDIVKNWPYYDSKLAAEVEAFKLAKELGEELELVVMRPTLILGPGDLRLSSTQSVLDFMRGDVPIIPNGGLSFIDVRDCAAMFIKAAEIKDVKLVAGKTFFLGDYNMTFYDFFSLVSKASKVRMPVLSFVKMPFTVVWLVCYIATLLLSLFAIRKPNMDPVVAEMSNVYWYLNAIRAKRILGFKPRPKEDTIADTVQFIRTVVIPKIDNSNNHSNNNNNNNT